MLRYYLSLYICLDVFSHTSGTAIKRDTSAELATILNHVNLLESGLRSIMSELQSTKDDLAATKTELQATKDDLAANSSSMNTTLNGEIQALKTELALKTRNIAFNAYTTSGIHSGSDVPLKFNSISYNAGNGYSSATGKFTAPVSGTYIFSTQVEMEESETSTYIRIMRSGSILSESWGEAHGNIDDITIPVTVIAYVNQGTQVWVQSYYNVYLSSGNRKTHFFGALLSAN